MRSALHFRWYPCVGYATNIGVWDVTLCYVFSKRGILGGVLVLGIYNGLHFSLYLCSAYAKCLHVNGVSLCLVCEMRGIVRGYVYDGHTQWVAF